MGDQPNWACSQKCDGMTFGGGVMPGECPAGGLHDDSAGGQFWMDLTLAPSSAWIEAGPSRFACDAAA